MAWMLVHSLGLSTTTIIFYGLFSGAIEWFPMPVLASITRDLTLVEAGAGIGYMSWRSHCSLETW
jgi:hypothetical protein